MAGPTDRHTGLCKRLWGPISSTLVVDYFGIGYVGRDHADYLMSALKIYYENNNILGREIILWYNHEMVLY